MDFIDHQSEFKALLILIFLIRETVVDLCLREITQQTCIVNTVLISIAIQIPKLLEVVTNQVNIP